MSKETRTDGGVSGSGHSLFEEESEGSGLSRWDRFLRALDVYVYAPISVAWDNPRARYGTLIILFFVLMGTVGVMITPTPGLNEAPSYAQPFPGGLLSAFDGQPGGWLEFTNLQVFGLELPVVPDFNIPLGTDRLGQPIGKQIIHATPAMLKMALAGAVFATGAAVLIGTTSGYKGGWADTVLMTATDIMLTIPGLPLVILLAAIFEPRDPFVVGIILAIDNWPGLARAVRSQVLTIREESYVEAARSMGLSSSTILKNDVIPQLMPYILINSAQGARRVIFESVALYFLGILPFSSFNWGVMMNLAHQSGGALSNLGRAGHWLFAPMIVLILFSFGLVLFSQGMDSVFNPRLRARHAKTVGGDEETSVEAQTE